MKYSTIFVTLIALMSCTTQAPIEGEVLTDVFDVGEYLDDFVREKGSLFTVEKITSYNEEQKSAVIENYNISSDIDILKKVNINNPNWLHKYKLETVAKSTGDKVHNYIALDDELKIQKLSTRLDSSNHVVTFDALISRDALISSGTRSVQFDPLHGYVIIDRNSSLFGTEKEFGIEVVFKKE